LGKSGEGATGGAEWGWRRSHRKEQGGVSGSEQADDRGRGDSAKYLRAAVRNRAGRLGNIQTGGSESRAQAGSASAERHGVYRKEESQTERRYRAPTTESWRCGNRSWRGSGCWLQERGAVGEALGGAAQRAVWGTRWCGKHHPFIHIRLSGQRTDRELQKEPARTHSRKAMGVRPVDLLEISVCGGEAAVKSSRLLAAPQGRTAFRNTAYAATRPTRQSARRSREPTRRFFPGTSLKGWAEPHPERACRSLDE